jgi:branched-chain amino acid transport system ATP-binding protein
MLYGGKPYRCFWNALFIETLKTGVVCMAELLLKNVTMKFGGLLAVDNLDLEVPSGKILSLIGPNGAGKTTVFNLITGVYKPTEGTITYNGEILNGLHSNKVVSRGIARTFQNIRLFNSMTVLENVQVGLHCRTKSGAIRALLNTPFLVREEREIAEKAMAVLEFLGLEEFRNDYASNLAYGNQRRLEIARAMATEPGTLLLDEPAAGMNPKETADLMDLILKIRDTGLDIFLVEHDMRLVMGISDMITVLDYGQKIAEGTPKEIQNNETVIEAYLGSGGKK